MIPWPVALLALFYGVIAALSTAAAWKIVIGAAQQSLVWALVWLGLSGGAVCGLALLRSWGRRLAIGTSALLIATTLAFAALLIAGGRPGSGLLVTLSTACHYLMIRYLQQPAVVRWFSEARNRKQ